MNMRKHMRTPWKLILLLTIMGHTLLLFRQSAVFIFDLNLFLCSMVLLPTGFNSSMSCFSAQYLYCFRILALKLIKINNWEKKLFGFLLYPQLRKKGEKMIIMTHTKV